MTSGRESAYEKMKDKFRRVKNTFRPEFLNRIDGVMVFHALTREQIREIVDMMLRRVRQQLTEQQIKLTVTDAAKDHLVSKGYDPTFGARPLRRVIQNLVEDELADGLLQGRYKSGDTVAVDLRDDELIIEAVQLAVAQS